VFARIPPYAPAPLSPALAPVALGRGQTAYAGAREAGALGSRLAGHCRCSLFNRKSFNVPSVFGPRRNADGQLSPSPGPPHSRLKPTNLKGGIPRIRLVAQDRLSDALALRQQQARDCRLDGVRSAGDFTPRVLDLGLELLGRTLGMGMVLHARRPACRSDNEQARTLARRAIEIDPDNALVHAYLLCCVLFHGLPARLGGRSRSIAESLP